MDPTIRTATADDHDQINRLDVLTWSPVNSPGPPPPEDRNLFEQRVPEDLLVVELDGAIAGYVVLGHPTPLAASAHVVEIQGLAVHPELGGRGLGTTLVAAAIAEARRRRARKVSLRVLAPNTIARRLYERAGFTVEGHLVGEFILDGEPVDDYLMALHLT
ncbi:MAG TPA: N-acetyltransferase [Euzebya sp.]|nr:N-acetyltransferase [Euzebya sp.]